MKSNLQATDLCRRGPRSEKGGATSLPINGALF